MTAGGCFADPVFVVASDELGSDLIDVHLVKGLSIRGNLESKAYVVLVHSRACNIEFYKWLYRSVVIPFVISLRKAYELGIDKTCLLTMDGKQIQIDDFKENSTVEMFRENNIVVAKGPASTSENTNACDGGNIFKNCKKANSLISGEDLFNDMALRSRLSNVFDSHEKLLNANVQADGKKLKISAGHRRMGIEGLMRVQMALEEAAKPMTIRKSFAIIGMWDYKALSYDVSAIL